MRCKTAAPCPKKILEKLIFMQFLSTRIPVSEHHAVFRSTVPLPQRREERESSSLINRTAVIPQVEGLRGALISCPSAGNITSESSHTVRLHNQALPLSPDLWGWARHALKASSIEKKKGSAREGGNEIEAAVIHPQDIPLGQTVERTPPAFDCSLGA